MSLENRFYLQCTGCGGQESWDGFARACQACPNQTEPLPLWEAMYDYPTIVDAFTADVLQCPAPGIWRAWPLLPIVSPADVVSLGEGATPLIPGRSFEDLQVFIKNESVNPTGSFKDRYDCVSVNVARSLGYGGVVCASTGNHALAVAAYAAAAGLSCLTIVADSASEQVLATLEVHGAATRVVRPEDRFDILAEEAERGLFPVGLFMPGPTSNPFGVEGYKTIAYELFEQLGKIPDAVVFPCARGNGLYGTWKGFRELSTMGFTDGRPRMYACQPLAAASLVQAFEAQSKVAAHVQLGKTIADATSESVSSNLALRALYDSGGGAVALSDDEIYDALFLLGKEGVFAEASSAMVWAGVQKLADGGLLKSGETVVAVVTSTGLKSSRALVKRILGERGGRDGYRRF